MKRLPVKGRATQEETPIARSRKQCNLLKTVLMFIQNKTKDILILVRKEEEKKIQNRKIIKTAVNMTDRSFCIYGIFI